MADDAVIIGREAAARELPFDLPTELPKYPGKALTHRFVPTEKPRLVVEPTQGGETRLTSSIPFKPLVSFNHPDKNVHLGPVRNAHPRGLQPVAIEGSVTLPGPAGQPLAVSEELRAPLEARVNRVVTTFAQTPSPPTLIKPPTLASNVNEPPTAINSPTVLTELEKIKAAAIEELAKREAQTPSIKEPLPAPTLEATETRTPAPTQAPEAGIKSSAEAALPELLPETKEPEDKTRSLLSEAERLESELSETLKQITIEKEEPKTAGVGKEKEDEYLAQISQLVADRTHLLKQINDITAEKKKTEGKWAQAETGLDEKTREFERQIQQQRIEKTNLINQVKTLEEQMGELQKAEAIVKEVGGQVTELKTQISTLEQERNASREQVRKLQSLLLELQKVPVVAPPEPKKVAESAAPKAAPPIKAEQPKVKIVKPQAAVGKMAPILTSTPNVINGIIKDAAGYLLSNVIIVVKDPGNEPVRALKTNKIGQFAISTPLPNGVYNMELETEGHSFDIVQVELEGKVLAPLEIRATT